MAFSDFKYPDVLAAFGLTPAADPDLFGHVPAVALSQGLQLMLPVTARLGAAGTEKARSEWLIAPVLADAWGRYRGQIGVYSGADPKAELSGFVDFLVCRAPQQPDPTPPAVVVIEAKNENLATGLGQCVAAMVGAERWNRAAGTPAEAVYGCVTSGTVWKFLTLVGSTVTLDLTEYTIRDADKLLGILVHMIGPVPPIPPAPTP